VSDAYVGAENGLKLGVERVRQSLTLYVLRPLAKRLGIKGAKIMRFTERMFFAYGGRGRY
jgi:hypothetical protein